MKKIYDRRLLVKIDGWKNFEDTSIYRHLKYEDEAFANKNFHYRFETFEEAKVKIEEGWILNAESTTTFFTKQPKLKIVKKGNLITCYLDDEKICDYVSQRRQLQGKVGMYSFFNESYYKNLKIEK